jgi:hypothetical protein
MFVSPPFGWTTCMPTRSSSLPTRLTVTFGWSRTSGRSYLIGRICFSSVSVAKAASSVFQALLIFIIDATIGASKLFVDPPYQPVKDATTETGSSRPISEQTLLISGRTIDIPEPQS